MAERLRAGGAGIPAFFTPTGVGTLIAEGKEVRDFDGRPHLMERALRGDFAFVKAWKGDRWGNLVFRKTTRNYNAVMVAAADYVIAEVEELVELGELDWIEYVQIFENRGAMMGASNPHPHGQIWSTGFVPDESAAETAAQREHLDRTGNCLLCDYVAAERGAGERVIFENDHFAALLPWWAVWPFEVLLVSRRHLGAMPQLTPEERDGLADALKRITTRFDNLFETSFPYTMGFHQTPTEAAGEGAIVAATQKHPEWHFHAHFYPPLLRSATVRKFMVGFEMLGMPQRDITPEDAAKRLRNCSEVHFWPRG